MKKMIYLIKTLINEKINESKLKQYVLNQQIKEINTANENKKNEKAITEIIIHNLLQWDKEEGVWTFYNFNDKKVYISKTKYKQNAVKEIFKNVKDTNE